MNLNQRKSELIDWISAIDNESLLIHLQELKKDSNNEIPSKIISLLKISDATRAANLIKHTSASDLLK